MLRVNWGGYNHQFWTLEVKNFCTAKLGIQIRYIFVLRGEMVKSGVKVAQKLQIVSDQKSYTEVHIYNHLQGHSQSSTLICNDVIRAPSTEK